MSINLCSDSVPCAEAHSTPTITHPQITYNDLIDDLAAGIKEKKLWKIGVELEQFAFDKATGAALPYEGMPGIRMLLEHFACKFGWEKIMEDGNPVALVKDGISVTLEPGGQVEYSGSPVADVTAAVQEMDSFMQDLNSAAEDCGIGFLRKGLHPDWHREDIHWMPKGRYRIMRDYMLKKGRHGIDMMMRSCGAQLNLDFSSEADMVKKFRVALALQPVIVALMANSAKLDGKDTGYASYRSYVWTQTDPDRCGNLDFVFSDDMSFASYVDYALDVPMYFLYRDGKYLDTAGLSFRDFMAGKLPGFEGMYPSIKDWQDHLTTLFPEVRLKRYLELRAADCNSDAMVYAMTAFWAGILYDRTALDVMHEMVMGWSVALRHMLPELAAKDGLNADLSSVGYDFRQIVTFALDVAADGLERDETEAVGILAPFWKKLACTAPEDCGDGAEVA